MFCGREGKARVEFLILDERNDRVCGLRAFQFRRGGEERAKKKEKEKEINYSLALKYTAVFLTLITLLLLSTRLEVANIGIFSGRILLLYAFSVSFRGTNVEIKKSCIFSSLYLIKAGIL